MKLCVFDLDGTLMDTLPDIANYANTVLQIFSYETKSLEEVRRGIGDGIRELMNNCLQKSEPSEVVDSMSNVFLTLYSSNGSPYTKVFDGIKEVCLELKKRGYTLCIFTNKTNVVVNQLVKDRLSDYGFEHVIAKGDEFKMKPSSEGIEFLLKKYNVEPKNAYMIGDGENDILVALNSNINHVGVLWGYRTKKELEAVGGKVFVNTPNEILDILK